MAAWIKRGRKFSAWPKIPDVAAYGTSWWTWWESIQPSWRLSQGKSGLSHQFPAVYPDNPWSSVFCGGGNGLCLVVVALAWWVVALQGNVEGKDLENAVDDVSWVLDGMISYSKTNSSGNTQEACRVGPGEETPLSILGKHSHSNKTSEVMQAKKR